MKARLIVEIDYEANGTSRDKIEDRLLNLAAYAYADGLFTGETNAKVKKHKAKVEDPESTLLVKWTVNDVIDASQELDVDFELSEKEARKILKEVKSNYDASQGVNWDVIKTEIRNYLRDNPRD